MNYNKLFLPLIIMTKSFQHTSRGLFIFWDKHKFLIHVQESWSQNYKELSYLLVFQCLKIRGCFNTFSSFLFSPPNYFFSLLNCAIGNFHKCIWTLNLISLFFVGSKHTKGDEIKSLHLNNVSYLNCLT